MSAIQIGDLVQFSQKKTFHRKCWKDIPRITKDFSQNWVSLLGLLERIVPENPWPEYVMAEYYSKEETVKVPMVVKGFQTVCLSDSPVAFIRNNFTKTFANVMIIQSKGGMASQVSFWVLQEDLDEFTDKTYLEEFKLQLKQKLVEHKMSKEEK